MQQVRYRRGYTGARLLVIHDKCSGKCQNRTHGGGGLIKDLLGVEGTDGVGGIDVVGGVGDGGGGGGGGVGGVSGVIVRNRGIGTGISEASKRVPLSPFATQGGKRVPIFDRGTGSKPARLGSGSSRRT